MPHGGARPNSGPKKGAKYRPTLDKEQARAALRAVVIQHMEEMVAAQIAHAKGLQFLMVREKSTGKFKRVGQDVAEKLNPDEEIIEVWEKEPSVQAFTDLLNRTLDKPSEHVEVTGAEGGPLEFTWLKP